MHATINTAYTLTMWSTWEFLIDFRDFDFV